MPQRTTREPEEAPSPRTGAPRRPWKRALLLLVAGAVAVAVLPKPAWSHATIFTLQALVASSGAALLGAWAWASRQGGRARALERARDAGLVVLAASTVWLGLALSGFSLKGSIRIFDALHYYIGAKYFDELGYDGLYECLVVADAQAGMGRILERTRLRDLRTNEIQLATEVLRDPERCTSRFRPERWEAFRRDVAWFRARVAPEDWVRLRSDHGYNPPPTWGILGTLLASTGPATTTQIALLVLIDPLLLAALFAVVARTFGWRVACIALIYLGTSFPASWAWVGGSLLRVDWLFAAVAGIACLRSGRPATAGALLSFSAAVRIFPALIFLGVVLAWGARLLRSGRGAFGRPERRFLAGSLVAGSVLLVLGTVSGGGPSVWPAFAANSAKHVATPLTNHAGLRSVLAFDPELREAVTVDLRVLDPYARWRAGRQATFASRAWLFWLLSAAFAALMAAAVRRQPDWVAAVVGAASIAVFLELTSYYHALLLVLAFLWGERPWVGAALLLLAAAPWLPMKLGLPQDEVFLGSNLLTLAVVVFATASLIRRPLPDAAGA